VLGLTRTVSLENQERGIRICAVSPGPIEGRMMASLNTQRGLTRPDDSVEATAIRYSDPAEVAAAVMFLFSDEASFITGSALVVDGGRLS
ncbi:MAG: SDR family oxidoreductase, partial [Actinobacteria bacterium]|nr:SDR family oxidoreductase [Actinomycetota bacterium]